MHNSVFVSLVITMWAVQLSAFADDPSDSRSTHEPASYYYWTHFVNGPLKTESGKTRFPVLNEVGDTKIGIFANNTDAETIELAKALDAAIQKYPQLRHSFFVLGTERDNETWTDAQLAYQLEHIRMLAKRHNIAKLSMGCVPFRAGSSFRGRYSLDLLDGADVVLAVIEPGIAEPRSKEIGRRLPTREVKPFYRYLVRFRQAEQVSTSAEGRIDAAIKSLLQ